MDNILNYQVDVSFTGTLYLDQKVNEKKVEKIFRPNLILFPDGTWKAETIWEIRYTKTGEILESGTISSSGTYSHEGNEKKLTISPGDNVVSYNELSWDIPAKYTFVTELGIITQQPEELSETEKKSKIQLSNEDLLARFIKEKNMSFIEKFVTSIKPNYECKKYFWDAYPDFEILQLLLNNGFPACKPNEKQTWDVQKETASRLNFFLSFRQFPIDALQPMVEKVFSEGRGDLLEVILPLIVNRKLKFKLQFNENLVSILRSFLDQNFINQEFPVWTLLSSKGNKQQKIEIIPELINNLQFNPTFRTIRLSYSIPELKDLIIYHPKLLLTSEDAYRYLSSNLPLEIGAIFYKRGLFNLNENLRTILTRVPPELYPMIAKDLGSTPIATIPILSYIANKESGIPQEVVCAILEGCCSSSGDNASLSKDEITALTNLAFFSYEIYQKFTQSLRIPLPKPISNELNSIEVFRAFYNQKVKFTQEQASEAYRFIASAGYPINEYVVSKLKYYNNDYRFKLSASIIADFLKNEGSERIDLNKSYCKPATISGLLNDDDAYNLLVVPLQPETVITS